MITHEKHYHILAWSESLQKKQRQFDARIPLYNEPIGAQAAADAFAEELKLAEFANDWIGIIELYEPEEFEDTGFVIDVTDPNGEITEESEE
jgi:hypothetical protein